MKKQGFHWRSFISLSLSFSFIVMCFSGVILYLVPSGSEARRIGWQFWQLGRDGWIAQHLTSSAVFLVFAVIHLYLNWRPMWNYIYSKSARAIHRRWELVIAFILILFTVMGTIWELPPWSYLIEGSRHLQRYQQEGRQGGGRKFQHRIEPEDINQFED